MLNMHVTLTCVMLKCGAQGNAAGHQDTAVLDLIYFCQPRLLCRQLWAQIVLLCYPRLERSVPPDTLVGECPLTVHLSLEYAALLSVLYCAVLCCAVLCCAVLCCAVLCYVLCYMHGHDQDHGKECACCVASIN